MPTTGEVATLPNDLTLHMNASCGGHKKDALFQASRTGHQAGVDM